MCIFWFKDGMDPVYAREILNERRVKHKFGFRNCRVPSALQDLNILFRKIT